jgi:hypothetical protein
VKSDSVISIGGSSMCGRTRATSAPTTRPTRTPPTPVTTNSMTACPSEKLPLTAAPTANR